MQTTKQIETDILVVGSGTSASIAAITAADFSDHVTLVEKGSYAAFKPSRGAHTIMARMPPGEADSWLQEVVEAGNYMADQEELPAFLEELGARIADLIEWGLNFARDEQGKLKLQAARGQINTRSMLFNGNDLCSTLERKLKEKRVQLIDRIMITDVLTSDGRLPTKGHVVGALGLHTRTGEIYVFKARAVILGTGPGYPRHHLFGCDSLTCDGHGIAYRAGAHLRNLEFGTAGFFSLWERRFKTPGQSQLQTQGARIINAHGESFLQQYDDVLRERTSFPILTQAIVKEYWEGRGPVFFDMTHFSDEQLAFVNQILPWTTRTFELAGIDIQKTPVRTTPLCCPCTGNGEGGVVIGSDAQTGIPGLFAAGGVTDAPYGVNFIGSIIQSFCVVSGHRAGRNAALNAAGGEHDLNQVNEMIAKLEIPLRQAKISGVMPSDIIRELHKVTLPAQYSMFKSSHYLQEALNRMEFLENEELPLVAAPNPHELIKAHEASNILAFCKLVFLASLERTETRASHYRLEYPYRDDAEWLKWITITRGEQDQPSVQTVPIPIERYPYKPPGRAKTPHPVIVQDSSNW